MRYVTTALLGAVIILAWRGITGGWPTLLAIVYVVWLWFATAKRLNALFMRAWRGELKIQQKEDKPKKVRRIK